jgi:GAF domain-containing protein
VFGDHCALRALLGRVGGTATIVFLECNRVSDHHPVDRTEAPVATNEERLTEAIRQMASFSVVDNVLPDILTRVAVLATETVDGADFVGLMMSVNDRLQTPVFTDEEAPEIDSAQYETGIGPCLDSYRDAAIYTIPSTPEDQRWRPFSEACQAHGVHSTMSVPVLTDGKSVGALNFYSRQERSFDDEAEALGVAFAEQAAIVIGNARAYWDAKALGEQLTQALESRIVIEQAKGLLMSTGLTSAAAFDMLRKASQRENRKLQQIAADLVAEAERRASPTGDDRT